jgi:glutamyl-tRNA synthetase
MIHSSPRVRFAPSPTGYLHVGGLRTALYNFLYARKNNGKFILRIEDTDRNRYVEGAVENLISSLKWCGLDYDEGPDIDGDFGPYMQSQRLDIYQKHAKLLIEKEKAYYCFCTQERLTALKEEQQKLKLPQAKYDKFCLNLSQQQVDEKLSSGIPFVIRLNVEANLKISFNDVIRDYVEFNSNNIDDQVLIKGDGYPTYHLANVVDDHLMKITHVIRGEEWLSSVPKHVLLYDAFNWERPIFAHLPLLLNPDRTKLSKRQGDVAVEDYRSKGFLKESLVNFVALLGWTAGDDREFYYLDELISAFSLERVNNSGAVFDLQKLNWLNAEHLRKKSLNDILSLLKQQNALTDININDFSDDYLKNVIQVMLPRVSFVHEIPELGFYFFQSPKTYDEEIVAKRWTINTKKYLLKYLEKISSIENLSKEMYENALHESANELNIKNAELIHPIRLAVSGVGGGPGLFDILYIIGKENVIMRINKAITLLSKD